VADIFKEVEEDLRRDKAADWWKRYSIYIYVGAAVVVIATAGYQGWRSYDLKLRGQQADAYAEAAALAQSGDTAQARAELEALSDPGALFAVMRKMNDADPAALRGELRPLAEPEAPYRFTALELLAALALREGDTAAAREHLTKITDDPAAPAGSRSRAAELLASLPG